MLRCAWTGVRFLHHPLSSPPFHPSGPHALLAPAWRTSAQRHFLIRTTMNLFLVLLPCWQILGLCRPSCTVKVGQENHGRPSTKWTRTISHQVKTWRFPMMRCLAHRMLVGIVKALWSTLRCLQCRPFPCPRQGFPHCLLHRLASHCNYLLFQPYHT